MNKTRFQCPSCKKILQTDSPNEQKLVKCPCGKTIRLAPTLSRRPQAPTPTAPPPIPSSIGALPSANTAAARHKSTSDAAIFGGSEPSRFDFDSEFSTVFRGTSGPPRTRSNSEPFETSLPAESAFSDWVLSEEVARIQLPTAAAETEKALEHASRSLIESKTRHIEEQADRASQRLILMLVAVGILVPTVIVLGYLTVRSIQGARTWSNEIADNAVKWVERSNNQGNYSNSTGSSIPTSSLPSKEQNERLSSAQDRSPTEHGAGEKKEKANRNNLQLSQLTGSYEIGNKILARSKINSLRLDRDIASYELDWNSYSFDIKFMEIFLEGTLTAEMFADSAFDGEKGSTFMFLIKSVSDILPARDEFINTISKETYDKRVNDYKNGALTVFLKHEQMQDVKTAQEALREAFKKKSTKDIYDRKIVIAFMESLKAAQKAAK